jgi:hypothetical protein
MVGTIVFLNLCVIALFVTLNAALRPLVPDPARRVLACTVFLWSYPVLYSLDRGNIEILLACLVAISLLLYSRKKFAASFLVLLPAICFKLYPAILLLLYFRRPLVHWMVLGVAGFVLINGAIMLSLPGSLAANVTQFFSELQTYNHFYIVGQRGVSNSANAWNFFRIGVWTVYSTLHGSFVWPMPLDAVNAALSAYYKIFLAILAVVTLHTLLVETAFARRAILLLLYMTVAAPGGGDYKLTYIAIALVMLILLPQRRRFDLLVTIALALCLIPKRELVLTVCLTSDSGYYDASISVITNPVCILGSMALLMWDGWHAAPFDWRRRLVKCARVLRLDRLRALRPPG